MWRTSCDANRHRKIRKKDLDCFPIWSHDQRNKLFKIPNSPQLSSTIARCNDRSHFSFVKHMQNRNWNNCMTQRKRTTFRPAFAYNGTLGKVMSAAFNDKLISDNIIKHHIQYSTRINCQTSRFNYFCQQRTPPYCLCLKLPVFDARRYNQKFYNKSSRMFYPVRQYLW